MAGALLIHLVLLPVLYLNISQTFKNSAEEQFIGNAREISGLLGDMFSVVDLTGDKNALPNFMDYILLSGEILFIEIDNKHGSVIRPREITLITADDFIEDDYIGHHNDNVYFMSIPLAISLDGNRNSTLKLGFDETVVLDKLADVNQRSLIILAIYSLGILLLMGFFTKVITHPLRTLRAWSREVAKGETDNEVKVTTSIKEVDNLSFDLEKMRQSLLELAERMQFKAMHDELTGLPNRALNDDRLEQTVTRASRENSSFAVLLLDLDRFKDINDTLGHGIGDEVLRIVASRLNSGIRESDTISRIGGDEFCAIVEGTERVVAENIALKLANAIEPPFQINGHTLQVGTSIGIAVFPDDGMTPELLIQHADIAMYEAKYKGLKVASYHEDMNKHRFEDMQLSIELRDGIKSGQFEAVFQPKIDLHSDAPVGCELLTQWRHPRLGIISTEKFIPLAERENLIGQLTLLVFAENANRLKGLVKTIKGFEVSINISPLNLLDTTFLDELNEIFLKTGFPASSLSVEVTENAIMSNPLRSARILEEFAKAGVKIAIDDFGTGYSSLSYLQKFPIKELKIDKTFVIGLHEESSNYPIVNATIAMAHDLGMTVVAEGVEEQRVLELLENLDCDYVQGYHFSKSMVYDDLVNWLESFDMSAYRK
ncbi:MAG: sensor domain-containing phosphodiesterase [Gammaproteobacteria bacterium]|nr:sensor domain-containing phosphodiesterase [Gammaproteobacteria bacterium]NNL07477.1 sensor domain-containing phosphodiesterase [Gammaproteobacteria bacterium]